MAASPPPPGPAAGSAGIVDGVLAELREDIARELARGAGASPGAGGRAPPPPPPAEVRGPGAAPPRHAKAFWKAVALVNGVPTSVYDGVTEYPLGATVHQAARPGHRAGLYVYRTVEECLKADRDTFPAASALGTAPRALLQVLAWEAAWADEPVRYGAKLAFSYVRGVELAPYPTSWERPLRYTEPPARAEGGRDVGGRPALRRQHLVATQAATLSLEREVRAMEENLRAARGLPVAPG